MESRITFNFETALALMKIGQTVSREAWGTNGNSFSIAAQFTDDNSKMTKPYLYMKRILKDAAIVDEFPYTPSCDSLFATDWFMV